VRVLIVNTFCKRTRVNTGEKDVTMQSTRAVYKKKIEHKIGNICY